MRDLKRPAAETVATQQLHLARVAPGPGLRCTCRGDVGDQRSDADRDAHEGVAELTGVVYRSFCAETQSLSCEATAEATAAADEPPVASAAPSGARHASWSAHREQHRSRPGASTQPRVAWLITGGLRSFFSPLVHDSIRRHAIEALGGAPSVFFDATLAAEAKPGREKFAFGDARTSDCPVCTGAFHNLSHFLSAHPEWARITASLVEAPRSPLGDTKRGTRPALPPARVPVPSGALAPSCTLPREVARQMAVPFYNAQLDRWARAFAAAVADEARHGRFTWIAKLRFDQAIGAPLSPRLLLDTSVAYASWPVRYKLRERALPLPDFFALVPRAHAAHIFQISTRYAQCNRGDRAGGAAPLEPHRVVLGANESYTDAMGQGCASLGLCRTIGVPPLCCGGGPTGLLVRALLTARAQSSTLIPRSWAAGEERSAQTGGPPRRGGNDAGSRDALPLEKIVLLETPMLVVGGHLSAKQYFDEPLAGSMGVSQRGYFDSRQHCWRVISACDRSE